MDTSRAGSKQSEPDLLCERVRTSPLEREGKKKATGTFTHLKCVDLNCKSATDRMEFTTLPHTDRLSLSLGADSVSIGANATMCLTLAVRGGKTPEFICKSVKPEMH